MFMYMQNNSLSAMSNMTVTSRPCICCFDPNYQSSKITLQVSDLLIKYLVAASFKLWMV